MKKPAQHLIAEVPRSLLLCRQSRQSKSAARPALRLVVATRCRVQYHIVDARSNATPEVKTERLLSIPTMPCRNADGTLFRGLHVERWPKEPMLPTTC